MTEVVNLGSRKGQTRTIVIDGEEKQLKFPVYSLIRMQEEQGVKMSDLQDDEKAQDMRTILAIIWAGLIHAEKDLTIEDLGNALDISDLPDIAEKLGELFEGMNGKKGQ